jgi:hypothetical protein
MFALKYPKGTSVNFWALIRKYTEAYCFSDSGNAVWQIFEYVSTHLFAYQP